MLILKGKSNVKLRESEGIKKGECMCHRMEHVTYLEGGNGVIVRETKGVRHVA